MRVVLLTSRGPPPAVPVFHLSPARPMLLAVRPGSGMRANLSADVMLREPVRPTAYDDPDEWRLPADTSILSIRMPLFSRRSTNDAVPLDGPTPRVCSGSGWSAGKLERRAPPDLDFVAYDRDPRLRRPSRGPCLVRQPRRRRQSSRNEDGRAGAAIMLPMVTRA